MKRVLRNASEYWLDPPEPNYTEYPNTDEEIELVLDRVKITVDESGSWTYATRDWAEDDSYMYQCEEYQLDFRDADDIQEDFDDIIEPHIPIEAGEYLLSCKATLVYHLYNIIGDLYAYGNEDYPDEYEIRKDEIDVDFDRASSVVENVTITKIE